MDNVVRYGMVCKMGVEISLENGGRDGMENGDRSGVENGVQMEWKTGVGMI